MSECFDWYVWGSKVSRKTVPFLRSLYGETAVAVIRPGSWNGQSTRVLWRQTTAAGNIPVGRVEPCRADTCTPEQLFWKWPAVESVASEDLGQASYALIFWLLWQDERQRSGRLAVGRRSRGTSPFLGRFQPNVAIWIAKFGCCHDMSSVVCLECQCIVLRPISHSFRRVS